MMLKKYLVCLLILSLLNITACNSEKHETDITKSQPEQIADEGTDIIKSEEPKSDKTVEFAKLNGNVGAGVVFDNNGNMFVARDGELDKISPDGKVSTFCSLKDIPTIKDYYFRSPLIWDMTFDKEGNILAAAQDRILKINPKGEASTLIKGDFNGFLGASGIELDKQGNIYITNGGKIDKYTPDLKKSTFIDSTYDSFFTLEFDPEFKNLYIGDFNSKALLKYALEPNGAAGEPVKVIEEPMGTPIKIAFSESGNTYVSLDIMGVIMKIDAGGNAGYLNLNSDEGNHIQNHIFSFGGKGFDEESIYITTFDGKSVYKYGVGEKAAKK